MLLLAGGVYAVLASAIVYRGIDHSQAIVLLLQHLLLLPALWYFVRRFSRQGAALVVSPVLAIAAAIVYCVLALALSRYWDRGFTVADEAIYVFQSKIFRDGNWYAEAPPATAADPAQSYKDRFFEFTLIKDGRWFTQYPPGWPALLAAGNFAKLPRWWINPLLGLLLLWLAHRIAAESYDTATARLTVFFLVASPFFVSYCIGLMSHASSAVFVALAIWCYFRAGRTGSLARTAAYFTGMLTALAAACLIRPATGFAAGVVLGAAAVWRFRRQPARLWTFAALGILCGGALIAATMAQNSILTGDPWVTPYQLHSAVAGDDGYLDLAWATAMRKMFAAVRWSLQQMLLHNVPFLFPLAGWALWRETDRGKRHAAAVLALIFIALIAAHILTRRDPRSHLGERFYFEAFAGVAILASRAAGILLARISRNQAYALGAMLMGIQAIHFWLFMPPLLNSVQDNRRIVQRMDALGLDSAVVFFQDGDRFTAKHYNLNDPDWKREKIFYLTDPGPARREELVRHFGRKQWIVVTKTEEAGLAISPVSVIAPPPLR